MHINIRSLYHKMNEVKILVQREKPHILGILEAELQRSHHNIDSLILPGYDLLLPKSWLVHGKARVVIFIRKSLYYEHLSDIEHADTQAIWLRAGFKNNKKIYFSHMYREHTNTLGNSLSAQRTALGKMLSQWEDAVFYEDPNVPNEVHIAGDINLDCLEERWLQPDYALVSLSRMVIEFCDANNFKQMVNKITRVQYNSVKKETLKSCIDHIYCNTSYRISPVRIITCGASDHDGISYTRYSREPPPPARTIRKRSYKNFVDAAAELLTSKLVEVLDNHAPWIVFQQRKNFRPWITAETVELMGQRDRLKEEAIAMSNSADPTDGQRQAEMWLKYRKLRNKVNNRTKHEEIEYKKKKMEECGACPSKTWGLAKKFMEWAAPGPPTQLEVEEKKKIVLYTKAKDLARIMNEYFITKVQNIVKGLRDVPANLIGCRRMMQGRDLSLSLAFVPVKEVRKLLGSLKNKTSTLVDQLDNYAVKLAADFIAEPLHHIICLSIMQNKFPTCWKFTKIVPLHKNKSQLKRENYRPVAILSPLSKVLEKVVYSQIYSYFERNKLFHPTLHGYRRDRSTMTALISMYEKWIMAASRGQVSGVVLVDLSAAFDLVSPTLLIQKLKIYGIDEDFASWILSYLSGRFQSVWIDHVYSSFLESSIGVPQGSNLGPLFFLIFFNDLPAFINESIDCYADDSTLAATGASAEEISTKLSRDCGELNNWMISNKFKLNADKTHFLVMGTANKLRTMVEEKVVVEMDGVQLEESSEESEVLLGIRVQSNLKWSEQINYLTSRLKQRLAGLQNLKSVMKRSAKKSIVQGVFNSVLCYCLPLFGGCSDSEVRVLQVLQNRAAQIVLGCPPRTSRDLMFSKLGWLTVRQLIGYHTLIVIYRIRQSHQPEQLAAKLTKDNRQGRIMLKNVQLGLYRNGFIYRGSVLGTNCQKT